jgi:hypothetical protein
MDQFSLPQHLRDLAQLIGRHEAGHYIVALALGFRPGDLKLKIIGPIEGHEAGAGIKLGQPLTNREDILQYLKKRVQVLYAGVLAQSLEQKKINNDAALEYITNHGKDDYSKVRELVHLIRNIEYPDDNSEEEKQRHLNEITDDLWNRAAAIVEAEHELINGLGRRLASEVKEVNVEARLTEETICQLPAIIKRFGPVSGQV